MPRVPTGVKSLIGSYGVFVTFGRMECVVVVMRIV